MDDINIHGVKMSDITPEYLMKLLLIIKRDGVPTFTSKQIGDMVFNISRAYLKLHEENQRLQAIVDAQRKMTEKLFIAFAKDIEDTANEIIAIDTLTRIKLPDEVIHLWITRIDLLALTTADKEIE